VILLTAHAGGTQTAISTYDVFDLDAIGDELSALMARISDPKEQPNPGDWCRYCPAMASCPAVMGIVRGLAMTAESEPMDMTDAAAVYRLAKAARAALVRLDGQLEALALQGPLFLGGGRWWGLRTSQQQVFSAGAPAWLREHGDGAAIKESVSMASLTKAVGKERAQATAEKMRAEGLVTIKEVGRLTEYSEKGEEP
jgi:hypothetical protein